jgi:toxin ParE1/3/4
MKVEYASRAVSDILDIADYYVSSDDPATGERVALRIREVVARIARAPRSGRPIPERPGVRVVPLLRYRYNVFYAATDDGVRILHIRHSSRRPWTGG